MKQQKGFTLVEILISIVVGMVILLAVYAAVVTGQRSTSGIERKVIAGQDARAALELMSIEVQMTSFNPTMTTGIWRDPGACGSAAATAANMGIQAASATSISVEMDVNESGAITDASNEVITYTYDAANQYITRETNCGGAQPFLGDTEASGRPRIVRVINTAAVPVFRYFNGQGTELTSFPGDIPNIARIEITLWVETEDVDPNTQQRRRFIYSTSVIPRNHVIGMQ
ncbi:MAG: prepilin-type N-terminal cleavage/methylation domain-containing protein [Syntrophales bacterium]|jgi:prepilin-type N-terminal cleavage/methylation domain-containing protein|nr:prepilin-type N-terminal cleavage/methylation domain-containing protein [Syntrophales bacterium]